MLAVALQEAFDKNQRKLTGDEKPAQVAVAGKSEED
jgi:hypothetical protein